MIRLHSHAQERMRERGANEQEVIITVEEGEIFSAKYGRTGFRRNFPFNSIWRGKHYTTKQIEAYAFKEGNDLVIVTVITRYF